ncbi:MAG: sodium/proline symporter [Spirochaetaceae bacterium]|jgi:sodium/proline symporter|nr:sodium/proline symporter [Spirochaetaceae bacterium]
MRTVNFQTLIGMGVYLVIMIVIGIWYARRSNSSPEEYFLGNRGLGPWVAAISAEASDMSGWLLMGLPGVAYFTGSCEAFWTAVGLAAGTWINWRIVAKRLRTYSQIANNAITLPEFFSNRFHDTKRILMTIAAVMNLLFFSIYVGAQFVTFAKVFGYVFGAEQYYTAMVILGAAIVLIYTLLGGFLAASMTDLIQGMLMIGAILLVLAAGFRYAGGFAGTLDKLRDFPRFLDIFGIAEPIDAAGAAVAGGTVQAIADGKPLFGAGSPYSLLNIVSCLAWGLGYFGMPQVLVRFMAIQNPGEIRNSRRIAVTWCGISLAAAVSIGLIGRAVFPALLTTAGAAEHIFLYLSQDFFPAFLAGLVISGILAASMSSSDSYMLIVSSALANDLFKGLFKKDAGEILVMRIARITMLMVTVFGITVALSGNQSIFRIVSYAWAGLGASFGPLILFSLFWKRTTLAGAVGGMASGGFMAVLWKEVISKAGGVFGVYELLPAFIISSLVIVLISLGAKPPSADITAEFEAAEKQSALP